MNDFEINYHDYRFHFHLRGATIIKIETSNFVDNYTHIWQKWLIGLQFTIKDFSSIKFLLKIRRNRKYWYNIKSITMMSMIRKITILGLLIFLTNRAVHSYRRPVTNITTLQKRCGTSLGYLNSKCLHWVLLHFEKFYFLIVIGRGDQWDKRGFSLVIVFVSHHRWFADMIWL